MSKEDKKIRKTTDAPIFFIAVFNFLIIILLLIYIVYLRFIPYTIVNFDGYGVAGKDLTSNLLNKEFNGNETIKAVKVKEQDEIFKNLKSFYVGASKDNNINLDYPIYINDSLAIYNLSSEVTLITDHFQEKEGYYILMKNKDRIYINTKEIQINTAANTYKLPLNSIINFSEDFITFYTLNGEEFLFNC